MHWSRENKKMPGKAFHNHNHWLSSKRVYSPELQEFEIKFIATMY